MSCQRCAAQRSLPLVGVEGPGPALASKRDQWFQLDSPELRKMEEIFALMHFEAFSAQMK